MSDFRNTAYTNDVIFEGDQIIDVENAHTRLHRRSVNPRTGKPGPSRPESFPPYVFREYPKMKYHAKHGHIIVNNKPEEDSLGGSWQDKPFEVARDKKPMIVVP